VVKEISAALDGKEFDKNIPFSYRREIIMEHLEKLVELKGEKAACLEMRTHVAWYVKGLRHATVFKRKLNEISSINDIITLMDEYEKVLEGEER
jgi:tRNA-dihydrouridine synthase